MLTISIPLNYFEVRYTATVLFREFLGLKFNFIDSEVKSWYSIQLANGAQLQIKNQFFEQFNSGLNYLQKENIPDATLWMAKSQNQFIPQKDIPVFFGEPEIETNKAKIKCSIDVFASIFFMLSRWEEYVYPERDLHKRFSAKASFAIKAGFLKRPIVDEYVEMVWEMLTYLGINQARRKRNFQAVITHDVDLPLKWPTPFSFLKGIGGALLKRRSTTEAYGILNGYIKHKKAKRNDPFDTFDYLMDISEANNLQSYFFFLCNGKTKKDKNHLPPSHPFILKLMDKINKRGHVIGFHPSYNAFNNGELFKNELELLQQYSPQEIKCGRQHFLRFEMPTTWRIWDENGLEWESSMYFASLAGFRCGTCHAFPVFDLCERKTLKLKELPLTAMDVTWMKYKQISTHHLVDEFTPIIETVKRYNGNFVLLWHNSGHEPSSWKYYKILVEQIAAK